MTDAGLLGRSDRFPSTDEINIFEQLSFRRTWMSYADQVDERIARRN